MNGREVGSNVQCAKGDWLTHLKAGECGAHRAYLNGLTRVYAIVSATPARTRIPTVALAQRDFSAVGLPLGRKFRKWRVVRLENIQLKKISLLSVGSAQRHPLGSCLRDEQAVEWVPVQGRQIGDVTGLPRMPYITIIYKDDGLLASRRVRLG